MRTWLADKEEGFFSEHFQSRVREQGRQRREEVSAPSTVLSFRDCFAQNTEQSSTYQHFPPLINKAIIFKGSQGGGGTLIFETEGSKGIQKS